MSGQCPKCLGKNSDSCDWCSGSRWKLMLAVLTAPLLFLLTACDPPPPEDPPTSWVQLINGWGLGIFFVAISLVWALQSRWERPKHCKGCRCAPVEDE